MKELYLHDSDFLKIFAACVGGTGMNDYYVSDGFLFKKSKLCIPRGSVRELLVKEAHRGGLIGHFGVDKTYVMLNEQFFFGLA